MAQDTVTDKNQRAGAGYLFAIIASVGLGSAVAFSRASYDGGTDPLSVSTVRAVFGSCLVGLFCVLSGRSLRVPRRLWPHLLCLGLMIGYMFYGNIGAVQYIPIGLAALLFFVYPPLVAVFVAILDRRPVGGLKAVALIGAFVGLILMLGVDLDTIDWRGVALALAAGVLAAVNAVWIARVMHGMDVLVLTFYMSAVGAVVLLIASAGAGGITLPTSSLGWWGAFGVVLCQGCSIPFFYASLPRIGPEKAAMLNNLQPVTSVLMAYFLFAELLSSVQILGGAMVLGGILLMQWQDRRN